MASVLDLIIATNQMSMAGFNFFFFLRNVKNARHTFSTGEGISCWYLAVEGYCERETLHTWPLW